MPLQLLDKAFAKFQGDAADGRQFVIHRIREFSYKNYHCFVAQRAGEKNIRQYIQTIKGDKRPVLQTLFTQSLRGMYMQLCVIIIDH